MIMKTPGLERQSLIYSQVVWNSNSLAFEEGNISTDQGSAYPILISVIRLNVMHIQMGKCMAPLHSVQCSFDCNVSFVLF